MEKHKIRLLEEPWWGWRYLWILNEDGEPEAHEAYKMKGYGVSWTVNPVHVVPLPKALEELLWMAENQIFFTEDELQEYNDRRKDEREKS